MLRTATKEYIAQTRELFHCKCKVKIPLKMGESLLNECFELMEFVDKTYNSYQSGSYFDQINRNAGNWVTVDETTTGLIKALKLVTRLTQGTYDITAMPLLKIWGFYDQYPKVPTVDDRNSALEKINASFIEIDGNNVKINKGQEIITGSFIKAFAVDMVVQLLKSKGVTDAIVNVGGSTIFALSDETHPQWKINVPGKSPEEKWPIYLQNKCFSLSASQFNQLVIDGQTYSHILNAKTGMPSQAMQVGVISESAFLSDVLSTALFSIEQEQITTISKNLQQHFSFDFYRIEQNGQTFNANYSIFKI